MEKADKAILVQVGWKPDVLVFAVKIVRKALELYAAGTYYVGADDVQDDPGGSGVAGSAVRLLVQIGVLQHWRGSVESEKLFGGFRPSKRATRNGSLVQVYTMTARSTALTFLERHDAAAYNLAPVQLSLAIQEARNAETK
jgi:hypothetical protein